MASEEFISVHTGKPPEGEPFFVPRPRHAVETRAQKAKKARRAELLREVATPTRFLSPLGKDRQAAAAAELRRMDEESAKAGQP